MKKRILCPVLRTILVTTLAGGMGATGHADSMRPASAPERPSLTAAGNSYSPSFSADSRFVAFLSHANNLVTNDDRGPHLDLFVRDVVSSNPVLVSVSTNGFGGANDNVRSAVLSSNGQFIVFETDAANLAPGDANRLTDIYVRDQSARTTSLVSVSFEGSGAGNAPSFNPLISVDGRYVIFESRASNLVTNDFNGTNDIFIRDLALGLTALVSVNAPGTAAPDGPSHSAAISADGRTIAFVSLATNLVEGVTNQLGEVYVRHVVGASNQWVTASHLLSTWARGPASGQPIYYRAAEPVLSADGRYVAFKAENATVRFDLHRPTNSVLQLFTNGVDRALFRWDENPRLGIAATAAPLVFDPTGRLVTFESRVSLTPNVGPRGIVQVDFETLQTNVTFQGQGDIWSTNIGPTMDLVVTNLQTVIPWLPAWSRLDWLGASADGARVAFVANATNLIEGVTNSQLYTTDVSTRQLQLISANRSGQPGPDLSGVVPAISADGARIGWDTPDELVINGDANRAWDVFTRELASGGVELISVARPELPATTGSGLTRLDPIVLSADGLRIGFVSTDSSLTANDTNNWEDVFVRDAATGTNVAVSSIPVRSVGGLVLSSGTNTAAAPILSADGRFVAFAREIRFQSSTNRAIIWWDLATVSNRTVASGNSISGPIMTSDGGLVGYASGDPFTGQFSDGNGQSDVAVYRARTRATIVGGPQTFFGPSPLVVSTPPDGYGTGNGASINPRFNPDGTWIVFQSNATNLVQEYAVRSSEFQLYARQVGCTEAECATNILLRSYAGPTRLISYGASSSTGDVPLTHGATNPVFSANGRYVAFETTNRIYRHDLEGGFVVSTVVVAGATVTNRSRVPNVLVCSECASPALSGDGRFVAYESRPAGPGVTNVFVVDLLTGSHELVSVNLPGTSGGNLGSFAPTLSHDARYVVFTSSARDLVADDVNGVTDVFLRDHWNGVTRCLSSHWQGAATGHGASSQPVLSADGRTVAFQSWADDLVPGDYNDRRDVFMVTLAGPDTDGDGMDDELEIGYFDTLSRDGTGDFDGDGVSDSVELRSGTNPADGFSVFAVLGLSTTVLGNPLSAGFRTTVVTWQAAPGQRYRVQHRADLQQSIWTDIDGDVTAQGTVASKIHVIFSASGSPQRGYYRVRLLE